MNLEQYQPVKSWMFRCVGTFTCATAIAAGSVGCRGTAPSFSQAFNSLGAPARVPPPAQGSFQVPSTYSNGTPGNTNSSSSGLGSSSFGNGPKTSQFNGPPSPLLNNLAKTQSQILSATNNARNTVNRTADGINSSVEMASARVDRIGQGVSQASAIFSESLTAPIVSSETETPNFTNSSSGRIGDTETIDNAKWRNTDQALTALSISANTLAPKMR